jgi:hypothetical protein
MNEDLDPASWAANRSAAGVALLGFAWSSAFWGAATYYAVAGNDEVAQALFLISGVLGLMMLMALTTIGWRLAFLGLPPGDNAPAAASSVPPPTSQSTGPRDGTPSVRIIKSSTPESTARIAIAAIVASVCVIILVALILAQATG